MSAETARLSSDYDGTAVVKHRTIHPNNGPKFRLPMIEGYTDLLRGFQSDGGTFGEIMTVRVGKLRQGQTKAGMQQHGIDRFFDPEEGVYYAGRTADGKANEGGKAERALSFTDGPSVFVDDLPRPRNVGTEILHRMRGIEVGRQVLTLAVAPHTHQDHRIDALLSHAETMGGANVSGTHEGLTRIHMEHAKLVVIALEQYTEHLGSELHALSVFEHRES